MIIASINNQITYKAIFSSYGRTLLHDTSIFQSISTIVFHKQLIFPIIYQSYVGMTTEISLEHEENAMSLMFVS